MLCIPPYTPLYIVKLGFAGVYLFFLCLIQNIDCGYPLEPPGQGGSNAYPQCFEKNIKNINFCKRNFQFLLLKKNLYIAWASFRND